MPKFPAYVSRYPAEENPFAAESWCCALEIAPPDGSVTIKQEDWKDAALPAPRKDKRRAVTRSEEAWFLHDYRSTEISQFFADRFRAREGDFILIWVRDPDSPHERGFYTRVTKVHSNDDRGARFLRVSFADLCAEFVVRPEVPTLNSNVSLKLKRGRPKCYDRDTKEDM